MNYLYLLIALLVLGDLVVLLCWLRERRRHGKTTNALRFWQRHSTMNRIDPKRFVL